MDHNGHVDLMLSGRTFIVTGGSKGLGLATAKELVNEGAHVVLAARTEQPLIDAVHSLGGYDFAVGVPCDLADETAAERLVATAIGRFGRVDGAVVSSGGPSPGGPLSVDMTAWDTSYHQHLLGTIRMARAVSSAIVDDPSPTTPPGGGHSLSGTRAALLYVLSSSFRQTVPDLAISNAFRPAVAHLISDLADSLGESGIRVNGIAPGRFATDRTFALDARMGSPEKIRAQHEGRIPLRRYGQPDEFGRLAAFLVSPAASYINGTVLTIDGGLLRGV